MPGHAETWLHGGLAGIRIDMSRPPAERIRIAPQPVDGIQAASARYRSVLGEVAVVAIITVASGRYAFAVPEI